MFKQSDDAILAACDACLEEEFLIYEWENTPWAEGPQPPVDLAPELIADLQAPPVLGPDRSDDPLSRALELIGSSMSSAEVRERVATAGSPNELLQAIVGSCIRPPQLGAMEQLLPVLFQVWNETPRPELGGRSPVDMRGPATGPTRKVGRNEPCPCGSGRKYKRCCLNRTVH
ncbi:MAG: SEC-C metal-binding domain-containing protein [Enhygromyxa sp.]